jgi:PPOX class probable F420-dependent enzyme
MIASMNTPAASDLLDALDQLANEGTHDPASAPWRVPLAERLARDEVVWVSTTRPDGRPHVVPVWFTWDGELLTFFSKPDAQKVRNLEANPNVMLALGSPDETMDVELIEGRAEVVAAPDVDVESCRLDKYAGLMAHIGLTVDQFVQTYSQVIRVRPTRFLGWGGPGWLHRAATAG